MSTGTFYPVVSGDDGHVFVGNSFSNNTRLWLGAASIGPSYNLFVRFPAISIPHGVTITSAFVRFTAFQAGNNYTVNARCYFNESTNAVAPTDEASFNALDLTSGVSWLDIPQWVDGTQYDSPDLSSILQEITDQSGWASGNAVQVVIKDTGSSSNAAIRYSSSVDYDGGSEVAELHVVWIASAADEVATWNPYDSGSNITFSSDLLTATHA
jgi:hypothetical protein